MVHPTPPDPSTTEKRKRRPSKLRRKKMLRRVHKAQKESHKRVVVPMDTVSKVFRELLEKAGCRSSVRGDAMMTVRFALEAHLQAHAARGVRVMVGEGRKQLTGAHLETGKAVYNMD